MKRGGDGGFTLVELMLVVAALSVLAIGGVLAAGRFPPAPTPDAQVLAALDAELTARARTARQVQGLAVTAEGFRRLERRGTAWEPRGTRGRWQGTAVWTLPGDMAVQAEPILLFMPDGRATAFGVVFRHDHGVTHCSRSRWDAPRCLRP